MKRVLSRVPRLTLVLLLLIPTLLLIDALCYRISLPVEMSFQRGTGILTVGSTQLVLDRIAQPLALLFPSRNPLVHEYQLDGSDSTNNLDLDTGYLSQISDSPYYRLQAWMRDLDGTSRWRDLSISANGHPLAGAAWPGDGSQFALPIASDLQIHLQLQRPETPVAFNLALRDGSLLQIKLDRNNRQIQVSDVKTALTIASTFFPNDPAPFAAMIVDTLARIMLWAIVALLVVQGAEVGIGLVRGRWKWRQRPATSPTSTEHKNQRTHPPQAPGNEIKSQRTHPPQAPGARAGATSNGLRGQAPCNPRRMWRKIPLFQALHPVALIALGCSLGYVIWIAVVQYQGQPHIYDANAYFFTAKIYASWHLSVPAPSAKDLFPGPFMVIFKGRWFGQYDPGTSLTLVPGIWLGVPWLVEPLLGTLALLGIGLIAARLYDRRVATLAVLLGCLSPFYSYLAASYLSHTVMLFYLVWGLWALVRVRQGKAGWNLLLCGICWGMAALTRQQVALLYIALLLPGVLIITWQRGKYTRAKWRREMIWWLGFVLLAIVFVEISLGLNLLLTGNVLVSPRSIFYPPDRWGFGPGIGFYGQHTLAAGLVNLDELLTILQIDLFGWPFYLTLALCVLPFLTGRAKRADWFLLCALVVTAGSYIGYFYHGIYLGPRYLFEDLPFLLILSARGILTLGALGLESGQAVRHWLAKENGQASTPTQPVFSLVTLALVSVLILCNLLYYLPRQATRYQHYTGLPPSYTLNTDQIYHPPVHHALVVTDNQAIYQFVLFPLNDPLLTGDVIYALGNNPLQFEQLRKDFPGRTLYLLSIRPDGSIRYIELSR